MSKLGIVGHDKVRPDALGKVTGACRYTEDHALPGMLEGRILMSPVAHARIVRIDTARAKALPGVLAVLTHEDCPRSQWTRSSMGEALPQPAWEAEEVCDQYILTDKVRYKGDWVAAVAAVDVYTAEQALELIEVDYDPLPVVTDPVAAKAEGAPAIHEDCPGNVARALPHEFNAGDVDAALAESAHVVEFSAKSSRQKHCHLEPDSAIAHWEAGGRLTLICTTQGAHYTKKSFAERIFKDELDYGHIRIITPYLGGGFGARLALNVEPVAALLSRKTNRPVRVTTTREEDFAGWGGRTEQHQALQMGCTDQGDITAIRQHVTTDAGGYYSASGTVALVNLQMTLGVFRCPVIDGQMEVVYTNTPTTSGFRGYGNAEGAFLIQQAADMLAEKIGMDPVDFRLRNIPKVGEPSFFRKRTLEHCALEECIRRGAEAIGWKEKRNGWNNLPGGRYRRGLGMSIMTHASGAGGFLLEHSSAIIKLNEDGSANLTAMPSEMGQGIVGALAQIAAEELGIRYEDVHIVYGDTDTSLYDIGSHASRSVTVIGSAVQDAARKVKAQVLEIAARKLGEQGHAVAAADLAVRDGVVRMAANPDVSVTVAEIAFGEIYNYGDEGAHICATGSYLPTSHNPNFQASFAEIEVDTETGVLRVVKFVAAHDIGRAISPQGVVGQIEGGIVQGLGFALTEDFVIGEDGTVLSDSFASYKLPGFAEVPEIVSILVEDPAPFGPFGAKGVGEPGLVNVAPAIANALYDAVGIRLDTLPMTPEKIWAALRRGERGVEG